MNGGRENGKKGRKFRKVKRNRQGGTRRREGRESEGR